MKNILDMLGTQPGSLVFEKESTALYQHCYTSQVMLIYTQLCNLEAIDTLKTISNLDYWKKTLAPLPEEISHMTQQTSKRQDASQPEQFADAQCWGEK